MRDFVCLFFSVKLFAFIRSIDVRSTQSGQIINRLGAYVLPCRTPATIPKKSMSPSSEQTDFQIFIKHHYGSNSYFGEEGLYAKSIYSIFPLCMESNVLEKFTNNSIVLRFFARPPSTYCQNL